MYRKLVLLVIVALLAGGVNSYSQASKSKANKNSKPAAAKQSKATATNNKGAVSGDVEDLINKSINAAGGADKFSNMKSFTMTGKLKVMGMEMPFTMYKKGKAFRMDQDAMGQKVTVAYDGTNGWMLNPMAGTDPQPMPEEQAKGLENQANVTNNPLLNLKERGIVATLEGKDTVDGKNAYKIKMFDPKDSTTSFLYIDDSSYLPMKMAATVNQMGQTLTVNTFFRDYRKENGIMMAHTYDIQAADQNVSMLIDKVDFTSNIDDSLFQMPKK